MKILLFAAALCVPALQAVAQTPIPTLLSSVPRVDLNSEFASIERYNEYLSEAAIAFTEKQRYSARSHAFGVAAYTFASFAVWQYRAAPREGFEPASEVIGLTAMISLAGATGTLGAWYLNREKAKAAITSERDALERARAILPDRELGWSGGEGHNDRHHEER